jgi:ABC-type uncharacterized transport system ATPase subunit
VTPPTAKPEIIVLDRVTKRFPGVLANDAVSLTIRGGEVHVLLGENGAGKSTLIDMLSGVQQPDSGQILVDGNATRISSPRHALDLGIGTVYQHSMLVPSLTVAENLLLGGPWWQRPNMDALGEHVQEISQKLGLVVSLDAVAASLSLGEQQQVEILRAQLRNSSVLILDESTSMLTPAGIAELGALMRRLAEQGQAVIFITHKLKEAVEFGDRISVLKLGRKVGEIAPEHMQSRSEDDTISDVVELMFGKRSGDPEAVQHDTRPIGAETRVMLEVENLKVGATPGHPGLGGIGFTIAAGEVLGIAGIDGNGQKQLAEALAGQLPMVAGSIRLNGTELNGKSVGQRRAIGLRYLTDDRLGEGIVGSFPVALNFLLKEVGMPPFWKHGMERRGAIESRANALIKQYDVRTPSAMTPAGRLSGGNIQKVLLARELADGAKLIIFNKPTHGLDLANTLAARDWIKNVAARGLGVLLISTDLEELLALSDRIAVMSGGAIAGVVENTGNARMAVGRLMTGLAA